MTKNPNHYHSDGSLRRRDEAPAWNLNTHNPDGTLKKRSMNSQPNYLARRLAVGGVAAAASLTGVGAMVAAHEESPVITDKVTTFTVDGDTSSLWDGVNEEYVTSGYVDSHGDPSVDVRPAVEIAIDLNDSADNGVLDNSFSPRAIQHGQSITIPDIENKL
ncbi:MAG: hypothetical protein M3Q70_01380 [bacterium]|nr:hypothetical protein [bacterium]